MSLGYLADIQRICLLNLLAVEDGVTGQNDDDRGGSGDGFSVHLKTVRPTQLLPLTCSAAGIDPNTVSQLRVWSRIGIFVCETQSRQVSLQ